MNELKWSFKDIPDLSGKVIIVTGGNSGLGYESVKAFAQKGAEVILASRSIEKGEDAKNKIMQEVPGAKINIMHLDLGDLESIKKFSTDFQKKFGRLDVLLNNAGIMMTPYFETKDGFEGQFGTNHLGHFALTGQLMNTLTETSGSRIVNVSSNIHKRGKIDFANLQYKNGQDYTPIKSYGRSKLANLLFTYEMQRKLELAGKDTISVAAHPGFAMTNLSRHLEKKWLVKLLRPLMVSMAQDQAMGALPQIRAAVDSEVKGSQYFGPGGKNEMKGYPVLVSSNGESHNIENAARLWEESEKLTGIRYNI